MAYVLTNTGRAIFSNLLSGLGGLVPKYIGCGTGTSGASASDTTLGTEVGSRVLGTPSRETTSVTNDTMRISGTWICDATRAITEVGTFDASSAGNMAIRGVFAALNLQVNEGIDFQIDWQAA